MNIKIKSVKTVVAAIILGAIGSGLWDIIFKDSLIYISDLLIRFISFLYSGYLDDLYAGVGKGSMYPMLEYLFIQILALMIVLAWLPQIKYMARRSLRKESMLDITSDIEKNSLVSDDSSRKIKSFFPTLFLTSFIILQMVQITHVHKASSFMERYIDAVAPYVSEKEHKILVSRYRLVANVQEYDALKSDIVKVALDNGVRIKN